MASKASTIEFVKKTHKSIENSKVVRMPFISTLWMWAGFIFIPRSWKGREPYYIWAEAAANSVKVARARLNGGKFNYWRKCSNDFVFARAEARIRLNAFLDSMALRAVPIDHYSVYDYMALEENGKFVNKKDVSKMIREYKRNNPWAR